MRMREKTRRLGSVAQYTLRQNRAYGSASITRKSARKREKWENAGSREISIGFFQRISHVISISPVWTFEHRRESVVIAAGRSNRVLLHSLDVPQRVSNSVTLFRRRSRFFTKNAGALRRHSLQFCTRMIFQHRATKPSFYRINGREFITSTLHTDLIDINKNNSIESM